MQRRIFLLLIFLIFLVYVTIYCSLSDSKSKNANDVINSDREPVFVTVCCNRSEEILVMIKSALIFSKHRIKFVIISEKILFRGLQETLSEYEARFPNFSYSLMETSFPAGHDWSSLFKPCASQRLFLASMLPYDKIVYVDSDTIFLSPPHDFVEQFKEFNATQFIGISSEIEDENIGWYPRFARHPYYGNYGVNSGVMLMKLDKMRQLKWERQITDIYETFNTRIVFGDQDLINIYFSSNPQQLFLMPCEFNYRPDHCMFLMCPAKEGIKLIHGNRGYFHKEDNESIFILIYEAFRKVKSN